MKAHDFIQRPNRKLTSRGLWYGGLLGFFKILKCIGVFIVSDLLKSIHVVQLLFFLKAGAAGVLLPVQKPFSSGRRITKTQWTRIVQHSILCSAAQLLWFYGITLCGPLRAILVFEQSATVVLGALSAALFGSGGPAKVRGALLLALGFISLILLDRDVTVLQEHAETHKHHIGLNHVFYHFINWFGVADHKAGAMLLLLALLLNLGQEHIGRKLAVDLGGTKRLYALSALISAIVLCPLAAVTYLTQGANATFGVYSTLGFLASVGTVLFLVFVADFYVEAVCCGHLHSTTVARYAPTLSFVMAFLLSYFWFSYQPGPSIDVIVHRVPFGEAVVSPSAATEHGISGGVLFTLVFFVLANFILTSPNSPKAHTGQFIGYSTSGMPLIFYFLCINLAFTFVEFLYGIWTNSLGLISDAFHMVFDCSALIMGLVAAVMSTWKRTKQYPFGYGRVEILSGFINGLFLVVIACFIFLEAIERLFEPPQIRTEKLLFVSVAGLCVNLFGMFVFHGAHGHSHGGGGGGCSDGHGHSNSHGHSHSSLPTHTHGHSHGGHGHSHSNANMRGVFLHVMADTLGSVGVIISTLLIQYFGWLIADPICSSVLAVLIFMSVLPLLKEATKALLLYAPVDAETEFNEALEKVLRLEGVIAYSTPHLWQLKSESNVATLHVQIGQDVDQQMITKQVVHILRLAEVTDPVVQVEKDSFYNHIFALCPSYAIGHRISRKPLQDSLFVKAI